ncbi:MAG TPA: hypothetical protein VHS96_11895 [Bacteroidia bacterium]|jgi:hypothetical protein|nr:hypothetical protein [Bacteroidia bacterium]
MQKRIILVAILLMLSIGNYVRLNGTQNVRPVHFLSIFAIGALSALLLVTVIQKLRE